MFLFVIVLLVRFFREIFRDYRVLKSLVYLIVLFLFFNRFFLISIEVENNIGKIF